MSDNYTIWDALVSPQMMIFYEPVGLVILLWIGVFLLMKLEDMAEKK